MRRPVDSSNRSRDGRLNEKTVLFLIDPKRDEQIRQMEVFGWPRTYGASV